MAESGKRELWDVIVVGGGIAGLTAAWHCARRGCSVALLEAQASCGGQVATVGELDDWPSTTPVSGTKLAASLAQQIVEEGGSIFHEPVGSLQKQGDDWGVQSQGSSGGPRRARQVIAATGARLRRLGVPGEEALYGKGVSQSADRDAERFKGRDVAVIGGGDAALMQAVVLAGRCRTVHIVVRGDLPARRVWVDRAAGKANVKFAWDSEVVEILGKQELAGLKLRDKQGGLRELAVAAVFPFVGVEANGGWLPDSIKRDAAGRVITDERLRSSDPGLLAVGALRSGYGGDLVNAAGEAAVAAQAASQALK